MTQAARGLSQLSQAFRRFGEVEATAQQSPIYERLSHTVAEDEGLLAIAAVASSGQPVPNLLFGAVHARLQEVASGTRAHEPLADYYPSLGGTRPIDAGLDAAFRDFVYAHRDAIVAMLQTRLVQTNEVRRSAVLLPAFAAAAAEADGAPLALLEVGPSAGLNLLFDRYRYDCSGREAGDPRSPLLLATELRGGSVPDLVLPRVLYRWGIDLNALDVRSEADMDWLRALLWPEHHERRALLDAAIEIARRDPPHVVSGEVFAELSEAIRAAPADAAVVVFATFVFNQFTVEMCDRLRELLHEASYDRAVWLVVVGYQDYFTEAIGDDGSAQVWLASIRRGEGRARRLGRASPHGWWLEWSPGDGVRW